MLLFPSEKLSTFPGQVHYQVRARLDDGAVSRYADAMRSGRGIVVARMRVALEEVEEAGEWKPIEATTTDGDGF